MDYLQAVPNPVPKAVGNNPLLRDVRAPPFVRWLPPIDPLTGLVRAHLDSFAPDHDAAVAFVVQNVANRRGTPTLRNSSLLRLRRGNSFIVEIDGDALQRVPGRVTIKNHSHRNRLILVHLESHSFDDRVPMAILLRHALNR